MINFTEILTKSQVELFQFLKKYYGKKVLNSRSGKYLVIKGNVPVLMVAHLDTVHKETVKTICKSKNILMSPQGIGGDDRCGVYALMRVYEERPNKPYLLFTCDEEIGGIGADAFAKDWLYGKISPELDMMNFMIEVDRKGFLEAVYYSCDNPYFEDFISSFGFITDWGTYSDIESLMPIMGIAGVNLSAGYYNPHTIGEYINLEHLEATIDRVKEILEGDLPMFEYVEEVECIASNQNLAYTKLPKSYLTDYYENYWEDPKKYK